VGRTEADGLTSREKTVLAAIGRRLSNAEIAAELVVSVRTVETHVAALRRKIGVDSRAALIEAAHGPRWFADDDATGRDAEARELAKTAAIRRDWSGAYNAYAALASRTGDDAEGLAEAAWWLGRMTESIDLYAEAFRAHGEVGDQHGAARTSFQLAVATRLLGERAQSVGWLRRCERVLESVPDGPEHGYPLYLHISSLLHRGELDAAVDLARRMHDIGRRFDEPTLMALAVYFQGRARIKQARVSEGLALLDESMVAALSDRLQPMWTGAIYCGLMDACNELRDTRRAAEWTEATRRWVAPLPLTSLYPGICRVHRAQVLQTQGSWQQAEEEAIGACRDMLGVDVFVVADGHYEVGEVRRLRGDLAGAEEAYLQAHEYGRDPQPGLALLRLAQGRVEAAASSIAAAIAAGAGSRLEQAPLHAAQVGIALAGGDLALAETSAAEVVATASAFDSPALRAEGDRCVGSVALTRGRPAEAMPALRRAFTAWQELDVPYEAARTRLLLAQAYRAMGDDDAAGREDAAAHASLTRLGVVPTPSVP
jgi:DNA-binding CsgD family transcriptional regulator